jgi:pimeloyl-ACP methyl ester carboxylesterase
MYRPDWHSVWRPYLPTFGSARETQKGILVAKFLRIVTWLFAGLAVTAVIAFAIAAWMYRDIPAADLEAKYANEASRFLNVAGVRIHYRDEGPRDAPALVLVHANFASLLGWKPWAEALKKNYRVIRFDMTSHGLTGPDPSGDYTLDRTMELAEKFIDAMGLENFTIGGTSLGGTVSMLYTIRHPERIDGLILLSPGSLEGREQKARRGEVPDSAYVLKYIMPRALPEFMLTSGFGSMSQPPEALIDQWFELWRLEGQREAQLDRLSQYQVFDVEAAFRAVDAPVLLLWGEDNTTAKFEQAAEVQHLLEDTEVTYISYPGVGHMAVQQAGSVIAVDVRAWLNSQLEGQTAPE